MQLIARTLFFLFLASLAGLGGRANAQTKLTGSFYFGMGTASDSSSGPVNTLGGGTIYNSPRLAGVFDTVGADLIIRHGLGIGGEISFRNERGPYAGLQYRPEFYDVNAVYLSPRFTGRILPEVQGGFGRMVMHFYDSPQFCQTFFEGCSSLTGQISTVERFQWHLGVGARLYVYKRLFIRPQLDVHHVRNLAEFGSPWIPEYTLAIGYTLRRGH